MLGEVFWKFKLTVTSKMKIIMSDSVDQNIVRLFNLKGNCKIDSLDASEALVSTKFIIKASDNNCINRVKLNCFLQFIDIAKRKCMSIIFRPTHLTELKQL